MSTASAGSTKEYNCEKIAPSREISDSNVGRSKSTNRAKARVYVEMAQASAWIQDEVECLELQLGELDEEIRSIEEKMRAEEATRAEVTGKRVFASRRGFAYQLGEGRREEERRKCATEEARRAAAGCREHIEARKKRQRSIEVAAKIRELDSKVGRCLKNAAENQRLAMEFRQEMEGLIEEQEKAVQIFGVEWARLLEEVREAIDVKGVRGEESREASVVDGGYIEGLAGDEDEDEDRTA
jgi:hypothetical protein